MSYIGREPIPNPPDQTVSESGTAYLLSCLIAVALVAGLLALTALAAPIDRTPPDDLVIAAP